MSLTVLSVAYPFAPVGPNAVGGAEQILSALDAALVGAGHRSLVIAVEGSDVKGTLLSVSRTKTLDREGRKAGHRRHADAIVRALRSFAIDLVHVHGMDFHAYLPPPGMPVLATLHLPLDCYPDSALHPSRPETWLNCVSRTQAEGAPSEAPLIETIENGVAADPNPRSRAKRGFALMLCRICAEKGVHLGIEAAKRARVPLLIAGEVFPYPEHRAYFDREVAPRLDESRRFIGAVGGVRKRRLLAAARCVLVPSLVAETCSLVSREALAAGTPVIGFRIGALPETVEQGHTGFLVQTVEEMAEAIGKAHVIQAEACRQTARERFSVSRMTARYFGTYRALTARTLPQVGAA